MQVGEIHLKLLNKDQALQYFEEVFKFYERNGVEDQLGVETLLKVGSRLLELLVLKNEK